jgi:hypothetical protein
MTAYYDRLKDARDLEQRKKLFVWYFWNKMTKMSF